MKIVIAGAAIGLLATAAADFASRYGTAGKWGAAAGVGLLGGLILNYA